MEMDVFTSKKPFPFARKRVLAGVKLQRCRRCGRSRFFKAALPPAMKVAIQTLDFPRRSKITFSFPLARYVAIRSSNFPKRSLVRDGTNIAPYREGRDQGAVVSQEASEEVSERR